MITPALTGGAQAKWRNSPSRRPTASRPVGRSLKIGPARSFRNARQARRARTHRHPIFLFQLK